MEVDHSSRRSGDSTADGHGKYLMSVTVHPFAGGDPFTLEGRKFSLSDTFSDIRNAIINQVEVSPDNYPDVFEFNDPKTDLLKLPGTCFPLEDHSTLGSVFGFGNPLYRPSTIDIRLFPAAVAKIGTPLPRPETRPPDLPDDGDHLDHDLFPKRPRIETLPFCAAIGTSSTAAVIYDGVLELKSPEGYPLCFDDLEYRGSLYTSASCVLLTPSVGIWGILSTLNQDSKYLVIHVGWDRLSFLLPRVIKLFYPDMPFVAVTDLTPHQLDLLTFLDTSQHHVKYFYGWDILNEADDFGVYHIERLDIKWLGLRPSDLECFPASVFDQLVVKRLPHDYFDNVLSKIEWNPYFSKNQAWVRELKLFKEYRKCVRFLPSGPLKNLVSNRLRDKDFV